MVRKASHVRKNQMEIEFLRVASEKYEVDNRVRVTEIVYVSSGNWSDR